MWREKWQRLTTRQKIFGTAICLCVGIMLFSATVWLKIQLNPVSFTQKEYDWLRANPPGQVTLLGPSLKVDGKAIGSTGAELVVYENMTVLNIYNVLNISAGDYRTIFTIRDTDLDTWPDDVRIMYITNGRTVDQEFPSVDKDIFEFWDVWIIRFLEFQEKEAVDGVSTLR